MHFSIPSTQEILDENSSAYTAFNLHVNGVLHCTVRYSQLFDLNERLKIEFGPETLPPFPPKKFFAVKGLDLEERREQLEKYVQEICQLPKIVNSDTFATFLSRAQQETQLEESVPVNFQLYLMNGAKIQIGIQSTDKTDLILENAMAAMGIDETLTYYFGLYLVKSGPDDQCFLIRQMQEFECPYLSLKATEDFDALKVVIRKSYWDQSFDRAVWSHRVGLNLLNVQAENDVKLGWTVCSSDAKKRLNHLKSKGSKREFVQYCQTLPNYGCIQLRPCTCSFPVENTNVVVSIGNYELYFKLIMPDGKEKEENFSVTRIKSWRVSYAFDHRSKEDDKGKDQRLVFSFEYLVSKGNLKWMRVKSEQAILLSMSIKSMVDELLRKRRGDRIKKPTDRQCVGQKPSFKPRDRKTEAIFNQAEIDTVGVDSGSNIQKAKDSVKKFSEKLTGVAHLSKTVHPPGNESSSQNSNSTTHTFENIGEEDL